MKKNLLLLIVLTMLTFGLFGCLEKQTSRKITVKIYDYEAVEVFNETLDFQQEDTLLELLQAHEVIQLHGETNTDGFDITEVCGINVKDYDRVSWNILVNGESSEVGVSDIPLKDKDIIELKLITLVKKITVKVSNYEAVEVFNDSLEFQKEDTLLGLLQTHEVIQLKGETSTYGFFITEICGVNANDYKNTFWNIVVNGENSLVGISDIPLKNKDIIELKLINW